MFFQKRAERAAGVEGRCAGGSPEQNDGGEGWRSQGAVWPVGAESSAAGLALAETCSVALGGV